jgi:nicotinate phosphoribosyltransferase
MLNSALATDLYMLTVANGLFNENKHNAPSIAYLFTRKAPFASSYTIVNGIGDLVNYLQGWHFSKEDIIFLENLKTSSGNVKFNKDFLCYLQNLKFCYDMHAMPEGSVVFPNEPILRIEAPLIVTLMLETIIINKINFPSLVSTKAACIRTAAQNDMIAEFGLRRAQGLEAGLIATRAAYIGGTDTTSNVLAGHDYNIPLTGTISHSWILAFADEEAAFAASARLMGNDTVLLVDTYNTKAGIDNVIKTATDFKKQNINFKAIRLDSGDLCELSYYAREKLDAAGLENIAIFASNDLDENSITDLKAKNAPITGWGIGTKLATAFDQPALSIAYKLSAIYSNGQWQNCMKISDTPEKKTLPGKLQVRRLYHNNNAIKDIIYNEFTPINTNYASDHYQYEDLLMPIIKQGEVIYQQPNTLAVKEFCTLQKMKFHNANYLVEIEEQLAKAALDMSQTK